ncbi:sugar ABC transporter ATP-binding protein [candidate division KSB1 bacterium]|nr:sugar ABC transporter ATP-binding protein [candidate division KSB1 bacterium]RQW11379.1 MAG: sugar ABC transporter ATP-binding protein [candidate division KSB1 bacterium]
MDLFLHMEGICKRFDAVIALRNVDLQVRAGTVHALIGENGAGKSTLMKILSGGLKPDSGAMQINGAPYAPDGPKQARAAGVSMIYQELTLAPHLTVEENMTLGSERHRCGIVRHQWGRAAEALAMLGHAAIDVRTKVRELSIGQQQLVEIARSLLLGSRVIIMDEPTSSLAREDTIALFAAINRLRQKGVTIIYISHFLEEIQQIANDYTILRDGESVVSGPMRETSIEKIVAHMVGRPLEQMFPRTPHRIGDVVFAARGIDDPPQVHDLSFELHAGEILGIAGLVGAGRTETLRRIFGLDDARAGAITLRDKTFLLGRRHHPGDSLAIGMSLMSENRKEEGLAIDLPIRNNISFSSLPKFSDRWGRLKLGKEMREVTQVADRVAIKYANIIDPVVALSGGNQQKVALARVLLDGSRILLLDEPTRGIDVLSKVEIYNLIGELAAQGCAIILVSSYLPELFGICDALAVMYRGHMSPVQPISEWDEKSVMRWATTGKV